MFGGFVVFIRLKFVQGAYRRIPCYYTGSTVHECYDWFHVIYGLCHAVFSLYYLALLFAGVVTAIIRFKGLWPVSLDQNFPERDSRLLLLLH
jgi:hypothetical protein